MFELSALKSAVNACAMLNLYGVLIVNKTQCIHYFYVFSNIIVSMSLSSTTLISMISDIKAFKERLFNLTEHFIKMSIANFKVI